MGPCVHNERDTPTLFGAALAAKDGKMGATLDALHRLQEIELQLADVQGKIDKRYRAVKRQEERIAQIDADIASRLETIKRDQMDADRLELDMKGREAAIAKHRQQLNEAKTNKEYSAILTQLNTEKADSSKVEERVLTMMNELEAKRKSIDEIKTLRTSEVARRDELLAEAKATEMAAKSRLDELRTQRATAASVVPEKALGLFTRIAEKNDGEALAKVVRTHPKRAEYACDGCNMAINIEQVNAVMSRDEAVLCNSCKRILYMPSAAASLRA